MMIKAETALAALARGQAAQRAAEAVYPTETVSGAEAVFSDGAEGVRLKALAVSFLPAQGGSGTPAVDNIRPISGITGLTLYHSGADAGSPETYPVSWAAEAGTVFGGTLDAMEGRLEENMVLLTLDGTEDWISYQSGSYFYLRIGAYNTVVEDQAICSHLPENPNVASGNNEIGFRTYNRSASSRMAALLMRFDPAKTQTLEEFAAYLAAQYAAGTPVQVCWRLQTARTYALPATPLRTFRGENRIWADSGTVTAEYRADIALYIDRRLAERTEGRT